MFRTIVIIAVLAIGAFMAGWFTIQRGETETTIRFNREEIRADTYKAIAKGKEILHRVEGDLPSEGTSSDDSLLGDFFPQQATHSAPPWEQPLQYLPSQVPQQY